MYISGHTKSTDLPTQNAHQPTHDGGNYDVFVAKFNATGNGLSFSIYLGGSNNEEPSVSIQYHHPNKIAMDSDGNSYTVGTTSSSDFPTLNAYKTSLGGSFDTFIVKMDPTGTANFSTYLGGGGTDKGYSIACDNNGKCYVGGLTTSSNFPTSTGCYQDSRNGGSDGFITVLAWTDNPPTSTTPTSTTPSSTASTSQITSSSAPTASSDFFTIEILVIVFVSLTLIFIWRRKTRAT